MGASLISAPPIEAERWFNTDRPLALDMFLGKVVVLHAFQMLCPGCVTYGIPQAQHIQQVFGADLTPTLTAFFGYLALVAYVVGLLQWILVRLPRQGRVAGGF